MKTDLDRVKDFCIGLRDKLDDLLIIANRDGNIYASKYFDGACDSLDGVVGYIESLERLKSLIGF